MLTITVCIGLPGSGKTTYALEEVNKNPYGIIRVNKDDLRAMCSNGHYSKTLEHLILEIRDTIIIDSLMSGKHVIVDDTNLNPIHFMRFKEIAKQLAHKNVQVLVKDFRDVPIEECIRRDAERDNPVGETVIRKMATDFMKHYTKEEDILINQDITKPKAIIVDIDGTVARKGDRSPYDYSKVMEDTPYEDIIRLLQSLAKEEYRIIFVSGRSEECRVQTERWLCTHMTFLFDGIFMRKEGDKRPDDIVKYEILKTHIAPRYYVEAVFDDRNRVVDMWRRAGIRCLQVQPGDF